MGEIEGRFAREKGGGGSDEPPGPFNNYAIARGISGAAATSVLKG